MYKIKRLEKTYETILLKLVEKYIPSIRKCKYTNKYFLNQFKNMLRDVVCWESLTITKDYPKNIEYHYKYLNQVFNKWVKFNLFELAYTELLKNHYFKLNKILTSKTLNLFIDTTYIINKYGVENITKNPEYKKKKVTKLSNVCDENKNILAVINCETHFNENKKCNVFSHDIKSVQNTLDKIKIKIPTYVRTKLVGDKAYITQDLFDLYGKNIKIIAPKRKNQKTKNTKTEKKVLDKRYVVENSNANFKKPERVMVRKDKKIKNYMGFVYLSLLEHFCIKNKLFESP
jgi:hypothetical protein